MMVFVILLGAFNSILLKQTLDSTLHLKNKKLITHNWLNKMKNNSTVQVSGGYPKKKSIEPEWG